MAARESVSDFYRNKSVLITGGTGSLGKILTEKLLRSCPGITHIYLLVRPTEKSGCSAPERLSNLLKIQIFDKLRRENADVFEKIIMVQGDLKLPDMGLSDSDKRALIDNVSIVLHCASVVKFDSPLKDIMSNNVFGTLRFLQLCQQMKKIKAFIYVSTLFSTCHQKHIDEHLPQIPHLNGIVNYDGLNEDDFVTTIPKNLVSQWPNTYTFSKAVTETMLDKHKGSIPISIVRPSIILSALREPIPGWIDNFYGPTVMIFNFIAGFTRSLDVNLQNIANFIPTDMVSNLVICAAWKTEKGNSRKIKIYNCCTGKRNPIKWGRFIKTCIEYGKIYPSKKFVRYPYTILPESYPIHWIISSIQEYLTAYIRLIITGDSKMLRIQRSIQRVWKSLIFFPDHEWIIDDHNAVELNDELNHRDKTTFLFDVEKIDWSTYIESYTKGIRVHLLKDNMDSVDEGRTVLKTLFWKEVLIQLFLLAVFIVPVSVIGYLIM